MGRGGGGACTLRPVSYFCLTPGQTQKSIDVTTCKMLKDCLQISLL